jgi:hypothetical protein
VKQGVPGTMKQWTLVALFATEKSQPTEVERNKRSTKIEGQSTKMMWVLENYMKM